MKVDISFRSGGHGITELTLTPNWAGNTKMWRSIQGFHVDGASAIDDRHNGQWIIHSRPSAILAAHYIVTSSYEHDPTVLDMSISKPVIRPSWFYAVGSTLFAYPIGQENAKAKFDWNDPSKSLSFASDLRNSTTRRSTTVQDVLSSIAIGSSTLHLSDPSNESAGVRVASVGHFDFSDEMLDHLAKHIIAAERAFWHASPSTPFLVTAISVRGVPLVHRYTGVALSGAFALWIDDTVTINRITELLAHEYFHNWNPRALGGVGDDGSKEELYAWFSEGFTDYYSRALMVRSGVTTPDAFVSEWNFVLRSYATSTVQTLPNARIPSGFWSNQDIQHLSYQRGAMLAALWNRELRNSTQGHLGIDDFFLEQQKEAKHSQLNAVQLFSNVAKKHGLDIENDLERYVEKGEVVVLPSYTFGTCAKVVTEEVPSFSLGFDAEATRKNNNLITGIDLSSPAYAAGLKNGMKVISLSSEGLDDHSAATKIDVKVIDNGVDKVMRYFPRGNKSIAVQQLKLDSSRKNDCAGKLSGL